MIPGLAQRTQLGFSWQVTIIVSFHRCVCRVFCRKKRRHHLGHFLDAQGVRPAKPPCRREAWSGSATRHNHRAALLPLTMWHSLSCGEFCRDGSLLLLQAFEWVTMPPFPQTELGRASRTDHRMEGSLYPPKVSKEQRRKHIAIYVCQNPW